jgi:hypothetical protein
VLSRAVAGIKTWVAKVLIRRYIKRLQLSESVLPANQEIENLQRQIALLKAMQTTTPSVSLYDQLRSLESQRAPTPEPAAPVAPAIIAASAVPYGLTLTPPVMLPPAVEPEAPAPSPEVLPTQPETEMSTPTTPETPVAAVAAPVSTGSKLPDVKMLAPILKIALATLSIEQMVEIGLHVKMGAPGFQQFLDSDVAKVKFRELYATYCDFLAGKVK